MISLSHHNPTSLWNPFNRNVPPTEQPTFRSFLDEFFGALELEPISQTDIAQEEQPPDQARNANGFVGVQCCIKIVFPDQESRPSLRTFKKWQSWGLIPFVKIMRLTYYDPTEVRRALDAQFKVKVRV